MITAVFTYGKSRNNCQYSMHERSFKNQRQLDNYLEMLHRNRAELIAYEIVRNPINKRLG